ncbi:MAG: hypothetical protein AAF488_10980 [Planctomycetota bacterium]
MKTLTLLVLFATLSAHVGAQAPLVTPLPQPAAAEALYAIDATTGTVYLLRDLNGDGNANGVGEVSVFFDDTSAEVALHPVAPQALAVGPDGTVYVGDAGADRILALSDLNADGDALDTGEALIFYDDLSLIEAPFETVGEISVAADGVVIVTDLGGGAHDDRTIIRLQDNDGDGYCEGELECLLLYSFTMTSGIEIARPAGLAIAPDGSLFVSDLVSDSLYRLVDTIGNEDLDANDVDEQISSYVPSPSSVVPNVIEHLEMTSGGALFGSDGPESSVYRWFDANADGVFQEAEAVEYWSPDSAGVLPGSPRGLDSTDAPELWVADAAFPARVIRLVDADLDGNANDLGDSTVFVDETNQSGFTLFSIVAVAAVPDGASLVVPFLRSDVNRDGLVNISDPIQLLAHLFVFGADPLECPDSADVDDDGALVISDAVLLLTALFVSPVPVPAPGSVACGPDPTADSLAPCLDEVSACP